MNRLGASVRWLSGFFVVLMIAFGSGHAQELPTEAGKDDRAKAVAFMSEGATLLAQKTQESLAKTITSYEQAVVLWQGLKDLDGEAQADFGLAFAHLNLHQPQEAISLLLKASELAHRAGDKSLEANSLVSIGISYNSTGDAKAIDFLKQGQAIWHAIGNKDAEANALNLEGIAYSKQKDLKQAISSYLQSLDLFREAKDSAHVATELLVLGASYNELNLQEGFQKAIPCFTEAAALFHAAGNLSNEASAWWGLANANARLGQHEQARTNYLAALKIYSDAKNQGPQSTGVQGRILYDIASEDDALQKKEEAATYYRQAIPLLAAAGLPMQQALAEVRLGDDLKTPRQRPEAMEAYQKGLALSESNGDDLLHSLALSKMAILYTQTGEWQRAIDDYKQALAIVQKTKDRIGQLGPLEGLCGVFQKMGDAQNQLTYAKQVLDLVHDDDPGNAKAIALVEVGDAYNRLGSTQFALEYLNRALAAYGNNANRETALAELGEAYATTGDMQAALKYSNEALEIARSEKNATAEQKVLDDIALAYWWLGDLPRALAIYQKNLSAARARDDTANAGVNLNNIALLYSGSGESKKAEPLFHEAIALARQNGDRAAEATSLSGLGVVYNSLGREQQATETLDQALAIRRELKDLHGEAITLDDLGVVLEATGNPQKALEVGSQAVSLLKESGDAPEEAIALSSMGSTYHRLGIYDRARDYFGQALTIQQRIGDPDSQMKSLNNLAVIAEEQKDTATAVDDFKQANALALKLGNRGMQSYLLAAIAMDEAAPGASLKVLERARVQMQRALQLARVAGDVNGQGFATYNLGILLDHGGNPAQALPYFRRAAELWSSIGYVAGQTASQSEIARQDLKLGHPEAALLEIDKAIHLDELQRSQVKSDFLRATYFSTANSHYSLKISILMALHRKYPTAGNDVKAFEVSEQARARSLLDLLSQTHADVEEGIDPALLIQVRAAENTLDTKESERARIVTSGFASEMQTSLARIDNEIRQAVADYADLRDKVQAQSSSTASLGRSLTLHEIQKQVLDPETILLEYSLCDPHSYLFAVTQSSLVTYVLPGRVEVERQARDYFELVSRNSQDSEEIERSGQRLSAMLLGPVATRLAGARLLIVADGKLQEYVPFAALPIPNAAQSPAPPLISEHEILDEPSASAMAFLRENRKDHSEPPGTVAIFADPVFERSDARLSEAQASQSGVSEARKSGHGVEVAERGLLHGAADNVGFDSTQGIPRLPHTREEADAILALSSPEQSFAAVGFDATKAAATDPAIGRYHIVHFATHGFLDAGNPELSGLVLSLYDRSGQPVDGFLRLNDIFALKLPVDLVVLSACESGQGKLITGEGLVGLTRGFFHAGASSLAVSLWSVDDASTAALMTRFYEGMLGSQKLSPAVALRTAQISMSKDAKWGQPYYWASFRIEGEWRAGRSISTLR